MLQYATKEDIDRLEKQNQRLMDMILQLKPHGGASQVEEKQRWLTTKEACDTIKMCRVSLERLVANGKITKYKINGAKGSNRYDLYEIQRLNS